MKSKLLLLAMMAAMAVPATQAQSMFQTKAADQKAAVGVRHTDKVVASTPVVIKANLNDPVPAGMARVTLAAGDVWEDGSGYQMLLDADATAYGSLIPETGGLSTYGDVPAATYAEFEYKIPENADGSLTTGNIVINNSISILIPAGTYDYCITNPTPGDRIWIASDYGQVAGRADDYVFEAGNNYVFTVQITDMGYDGVFLEVTSDGTVDPIDVPTTPEDVVVEPGKTNADVAWTDEDDAAWNLRYRLYDPEAAAGETYFWDFEEPQAEDNAVPAGWTSIDADGDGYGWYHLNQATDGNWNCHSGNGHLTSASYMGGALYPNDWLVSPQVTLNGSLSFWAAGQDASWADEVFAVYVTTGDPNDVDSYVKISDDITATGVVTEYTFDLSEYAGQMGYVAIRHYNCTDMFRLNIDDVTIGGGVQEPEWTYVYDITDVAYNIEGLDENTTYEVQVQATDGQQTSDWTESVIFTTKTKTSIEEVQAQVKGDNTYYNLMGQKMNPANLPAGIYIHNGQKVIVK